MYDSVIIYIPRDAGNVRPILVLVGAGLRDSCQQLCTITPPPGSQAIVHVVMPILYHQKAEDGNLS